jgi:hypothetical protein
MADIVLPPDLIARLEAISKQEKRSPEEILQAMFDQYIPASSFELSDYSVDEIRAKLYARARQYWKQLDEQFWLFDAEAIPRLKSEQGNVEIPPDSLVRLGQIAKQIGFRSGQHNIAEQSRDIVREELTKRLVDESSDGS